MKSNYHMHKPLISSLNQNTRIPSAMMFFFFFSISITHAIFSLWFKHTIVIHQKGLVFAFNTPLPFLVDNSMSCASNPKVTYKLNEKAIFASFFFFIHFLTHIHYQERKQPTSNSISLDTLIQFSATSTPSLSQSYNFAYLNFQVISCK